MFHDVHYIFINLKNTKGGNFLCCAVSFTLRLAIVSKILITYLCHLLRWTRNGILLQICFIFIDVAQNGLVILVRNHVFMEL